jgi:hypothetical protein
LGGAAQEAGRTAWGSRYRAGRLRRWRRILGRRWSVLVAISGATALSSGRLAQETTARSRYGVAALPLQLLNLFLCVLQCQILNQHCLCHQVQRIRPVTYISADEILCFGIPRRSRRLCDLVRQILQHSLFVWSHKCFLARLTE